MNDKTRTNRRFANLIAVTGAAASLSLVGVIAMADSTTGLDTGTPKSAMPKPEYGSDQHPDVEMPNEPASDMQGDALPQHDGDAVREATPQAQDQDIVVDDEMLAEQVAKRVAAASFDSPDRVEASDDLGAGWEITGDEVDLKVDAEKGAVTISGRVDRQERIESIERDARAVPGVDTLRTQLAVGGDPSATGMTDEEEAE